MTIGIDLGTSTCEAAAVKDGKAQVIKNTDGSYITPSCVGIDDNGEFVIGRRAADQLLLKPDYTAIEIKRMIGTGQMISLGGKEYTAIDLSARLLNYIKEYASRELGENVDSAVITVPAYFDELQRRETVQAGRLAGLTVERIINEPTAAALCYGIDHLEDESVIIVCDFGGGTFDVTVMELFDGVLDVKSTDGVNRLGGKDIDEIIMNRLIENFDKEHGVKLRNDPYAMVKLKSASEECKIALSAQEEYEVSIPMITQKGGRPLSLVQTISRGEFENMIADIIAKTTTPIENAIRASGYSRDDIDLCLLVGGTTRIPAIRRHIEKITGKQAGTLVDPDLAVAMGAAIQADLLKAKDEAADVVITDVCPFSLGIKAVTINDGMFDDDFMVVIIPRNTTIPVTKREMVYTYFDYQTRADILVFQGESETASENRLIGRFKITGIPPKKSGEERLIVSFSYDVNGMLDVTAEIFSTGKSASIVIDMTGVSTEKRDVSDWKTAKKARAYISLIRKAEKLLLGGDLDKHINDMISDTIYNLKCAIIDDADDETLEEYEDELLDLIEDEIV
ncbi:MAG: Hsp70 family protein [Clostridia bacterium]|nr:Hsp70 family protein [Clostridia bacterium]